AGGSLPARHTGDSAGRAGAHRRILEPKGAVADRGSLADRAAGPGPLHGRGVEPARHPVSPACREAAGPARGGGGFYRCGPAARLVGVRRRPNPPYRRGAVPLEAERAVSRRVLVVDDEKGIREALTQVLEY